MGCRGWGTWVPGLLGVQLLLAALLPAPAEGQMRWRDLVLTGGFAVEGYRGNFSAVTLPVVDSTDHASATAGEFGARGEALFLEERLSVRFDAGVRQFAATGFHLRDYAPRELAGRIDARWSQALGRFGTLTLGGEARIRDVQDRPPMPLFLQPGYSGLRGEIAFFSRDVQDVLFDVVVDVEATDYEAPPLLSQLDLLDRRAWGVEGGATFGEGSWELRFHGGLRRSEYRDQASFDPEDPFRRDRTVQVGGQWSYEGPVYAELGLEGTVNRSNSNRPEYDAASARVLLSSPLPWGEMGVNLLAVVTGKTYVHEVPFTRLVPGEEADNASIIYLDVNRPMAPNLDGSVRFGWSRAETDIGDAYYSRFGVTFLVNYRPDVF